MIKVLDSPEYIIEPGTDYVEVMNFFDTVHWSLHRMAGLQDIIERSNATGECFVLHLIDNVPHAKRLKGVTDDKHSTEM